MVTWGNNTTALFGTSTPANAPTTPAPSGGPFSFGGGAAPSTPPLASQTPPTNPPPLGGSSSASSMGGGLFGSAAIPAPAPAPAAPSFGGSLFASSAPSSASLFGAPSPAPSTSPFFGAPAPPASAPPATNVFGAAPPPPYNYCNPNEAALHAHHLSSQRQETARIEESIFNLHSKYSPYASDPLHRTVSLASTNNVPSSLCAFTAILYDPLPPEYRTTTLRGGGILPGTGGHLSAPKPSHLSNQTWNEALARNPDPDELYPTALVGAASLHSRLITQQEKANALHAHATKLRSTLSFLETMSRSSQAQIQHTMSVQEELNRRLLEIMRKVEIIRCMNHPIQRAEVDAQIQLRKLLDQVNSVAVNLRTLEERGRQQARNWRMNRATSSSSSSSTIMDDASMMLSSTLSDDDKLALFHVLNDQRLGMERLGSIVTRDVRDVEILKEEMMGRRSRSSVVVGGGGRAVKRIVGAAGGTSFEPAIFGGR